MILPDNMWGQNPAFKGFDFILEFRGAQSPALSQSPQCSHDRNIFHCSQLLHLAPEMLKWENIICVIICTAASKDFIMRS